MDMQWHEEARKEKGMIRTDVADRPPAGVMPPEKLVRPEPATRKFTEIDGDTMSGTAAQLVKQQSLTFIGSEIRQFVDEDTGRGLRRQVPYDPTKHKSHQVQHELVEYLATQPDSTGRQAIHLVRQHQHIGPIGHKLSLACLRRCALSAAGEAMLKEIETTEEAATA
jgi:hypothetical protein